MLCSRYYFDEVKDDVGPMSMCTGQGGSTLLLSLTVTVDRNRTSLARGGIAVTRLTVLPCKSNLLMLVGGGVPSRVQLLLPIIILRLV